MKLSILIPAYNEENTIKEIIEKAKSTPLPEGVTREILITNDGSTDQTEARAKECVDGETVKLFNQSNMGKSGAVLNSLKHATGDIILIQDADLEYDPSHYSALIQPILDGRETVVYGSRFMGSAKGMRPMIRWANFMTNLTFNALFGAQVTDLNTCFKVFKREALEGIQIYSSHFGIDTEVSVKVAKKGHKISEVPIQYSARTREEGKKITPSSSFKSYLGIFYFKFKDK